MPEYPEHEKLMKVKPRSQAIGEFLEYSPYVLAEWIEVEGDSNPHLVAARKPLERILADYFAIDLDALESEKRAMLEAQRALNAEVEP